MYLPTKADESWRGGSNLKLVAKAREALSKGGERVVAWKSEPPPPPSSPSDPIVTFVPDPGEYLL